MRVQHVRRRILPRATTAVRAGDAAIDVKLAERPGGAVSAKAEHDQIRRVADDQQSRRDVARAAEGAALSERADKR